MAHLLPLLTALLLCSYGPVGSLGCELPENSVQLSKMTWWLLGQMRTISPALCLRDRRDFRFPREVLNASHFQNTQDMSVPHEILQQISNLFHTQQASAAWNKTVLAQLRTTLRKQLPDLNTCSVVQGRARQDSVLTTESPTLALKRYFHGIHVYLEEKKHSDCAWELVRMQLRRALASTIQLQESLRSKDADSGSS
ncbi:interferon omega-1-like [Ochotona curzoniae]|uniref:interferon omega-1-like n=1 Tax=Ochotona curzoniae TaxID=130825 RepID=UPI001B346442|nr:interferon omega-1-like [Ochotona curzoniae]